MWDGQLDEGPTDAVDPLRRLLAQQSAEVPETLSSETSMPDELFNAPLSSGSKTSQQHVWMYGYGGSRDQLTHKWGTLTFNWNGSTATLTSETGSCNGSDPVNWHWVVDGCVRDFYVPGPASTVGRGGQGDYHCSPVTQFPCNTGSGYYHSLYGYEYGYSNGTSACVYNISGIYVGGVSRQILSGCS
jgi:hypothetical protein